ncbi:MAG: PH domain-containing protein, partial [Lachnospiraceae bacterium]|nr:PH domain-containing protein [Lachnospiraceae bacterium]
MNEINGIRNHWSYILEQVGGFIWLIIAMAFGMSETAYEGIKYIASGHILEGLMVLAGFFLVIVIVGFICFNRWRKTTMTVKDGVITIRRNTLYKKVKNINISNISNINLERNLFELIMGTYKLKIDTSSSTEAADTDMLMVFKRDRAEEIRTIIMDMAKKIKEEALLENETSEENLLVNETNEETVVVADNLAVSANRSKPLITEESIKEQFAEDDFDVTYSAKEFIANCIINTSLLVFGIIIAGIIGLGFAITGLIAAGTGNAAMIGAGFGSIIFGIFTFFSIVGAQFKSWETDINFRSTRRGASICVNTGLITRRKYTIPMAKINAIKINSSFLGVITKRARVDVVNIGGDAGDNIGHRILLYNKVPELMRKLKL